MNQSIRWRLRKNCLVHVDGALYQPRMSIKEVMTPLGPDAGPAMVATFDLDGTIFETRLADETLDVVEQEAGMPDALYQRLLGESYDRFVEKRAQNRQVRERLQMYANEGIVEVLSDPAGIVGPKPVVEAEAA